MTKSRKKAEIARSSPSDSIGEHYPAIEDIVAFSSVHFGRLSTDPEFATEYVLMARAAPKEWRRRLIVLLTAQKRNLDKSAADCAAKSDAMRMIATGVAGTVAAGTLLSFAGAASVSVVAGAMAALGIASVIATTYISTRLSVRKNDEVRKADFCRDAIKELADVSDEP